MNFNELCNFAFNGVQNDAWCANVRHFDERNMPCPNSTGQNTYWAKWACGIRRCAILSAQYETAQSKIAETSDHRKLKQDVRTVRVPFQKVLKCSTCTVKSYVT